MESIFRYAIFLTAWGWAGFTADQKGLRVLVLPEQRKEDVVFELRKNFNSDNISNISNIEEENGDFMDLIHKIKDYFVGKKVDFLDCQLNLDNYTNFQKKILQATRKIPYGETRSYKWVAQTAGYPRAYRAVGNVMRNNPIPLIIPCHRVIKSNGMLGGFFGKEKVALKKKIINLESAVFLLSQEQTP